MRLGTSRKAPRLDFYLLQQHHIRSPVNAYKDYGSMGTQGKHWACFSAPVYRDGGIALEKRGVVLRTYPTSLDTHYTPLGLACLGMGFSLYISLYFYLYSSVDSLFSSTYTYIISLYTSPNII